MNFYAFREHIEVAEREQREPPHLAQLDARRAECLLEGRSISLTITSPPYFDVKDYGHEGQIGFGQDYESYLSDLTSVFREIYFRTLDDGSLWIVIDSFRRDGELIPLPFDLAERLKSLGWCLKDIIIWKKDRTLPWAKDGATRSIFEYVLVFAKNAKAMKYYPDRERDFIDLQHWWVRYPERYNPSGKALEEVWNIDIPVQGSWGKDTPRHLCPLPAGLVRRILRLASDEGDLVYDPFAGTGVVLSEAMVLGRIGLGCEINPDLVSAFYERMEGQVIGHAHDQEAPEAAEFRKLIIQLRVLKFGRLLLRALMRETGVKGICLYARQSQREPVRKYSIASADFLLFTPPETDDAGIFQVAMDLAAKRPLSKFGLDYLIETHSRGDALNQIGDVDAVYSYKLDNSHEFRAVVAASDVSNSKTPLQLFSDIGVRVGEYASS